MECTISIVIFLKMIMWQLRFLPQYTHWLFIFQKLAIKRKFHTKIAKEEESSIQLTIQDDSTPQLLSFAARSAHRIFRMGKVKNKCPVRRMEVQLPALSENYNRLTNRPTDQPTDQKTDRKTNGHGQNEFKL